MWTIFRKKSFKNHGTWLSDFEGTSRSKFLSFFALLPPRIITQKHRRSQKWRSCHFGPGFANLFEGTVFKESDCWVATMYYTNQSTEKIIGLSDRTGNLEIWIPPPCVLLLKYSGLLFFYDLWKKDNILYPTVVGLRMISINLLNASHIVGFQ